MEDKKGDTLIYSKTLEANIALLSLIRGNSIGGDALDWEVVRANITRRDTISGYNFQFLIDAFAPPESASTPVDSTQTSMELILKNLDFKDFNVVYKDDVSGIDSRFIFNRLQLDMDTQILKPWNFMD